MRLSFTVQCAGVKYLSVHGILAAAVVVDLTKAKSNASDRTDMIV